ncbi:MAG: gas vesicle protein [Methylobacterium sp.]|nr:MAG: gas vesicle protein [Methylobacterium sp.]
MSQSIHSPLRADGLADILERVLDKGIVIAGDVAISLVGIELLTIKVRLLIASVDKAQELGINWWQNDPMLTNRTSAIEEENRLLRGRLAMLEKRMAEIGA